MRYQRLYCTEHNIIYHQVISKGVVFTEQGYNALALRCFTGVFTSCCRLIYLFKVLQFLG